MKPVMGPKISVHVQIEFRVAAFDGDQLWKATIE